MSPPEAFRRAEWNVVYMMGFAIGISTGIAASVAAMLWWRVFRKPRIADASLTVRYGKPPAR